MSVHKEGGSYRVFWREHGRQRTRSFKRKGDADLFDANLTRKRLLGADLAIELNRTELTLDEFVRGGFMTHAATLSSGSRHKYAWALENHLVELQNVPLRMIDVPRLLAHQQYLLEHGRTPNTAREALVYLSGILQVATAHGLIPGNPVRAIRKTGSGRLEVRPLTPAEMEAMIATFHGRSRVLLLLAGHIGLRPGEARQVPWRAWDDGKLVVERTVVKAQARRPRGIDVPRVTAAELREWRLASGRPDPTEPIVGSMTANALKKWTTKVLRPAAKKIVGRDDVTLYTLRHTHASACHYVGMTIPEAARRLGHGPVLHVETYAHVIEGLAGRRYADLDALIAAARNEAAQPAWRRAQRA
jgi:integrase